MWTRMAASTCLIISIVMSGGPPALGEQTAPDTIATPAGAAADTFLAASAPGPPGEELPLLEMLFRDVVARFGIGLRDRDGLRPVFLANGMKDMTHYLDPPPEIFGRLADLRLSLRPASLAVWKLKFTGVEAWLDAASGRPGTVVAVRVVRWISATEAVVECSQNTSSMGGDGYKTTAHKTDVGWELPKRVVCWAS